MSGNRLENDIKALLKRHEHGVVCTDMSVFRARLPSGGHNLRQVEETLRALRNRRVIRLKRIEGGTLIKLAS